MSDRNKKKNNLLIKITQTHISSRILLCCVVICLITCIVLHAELTNVEKKYNVILANLPTYNEDTKELDESESVVAVNDSANSNAINDSILTPELTTASEYLVSSAYAKDYMRRYVYSLAFEEQLKKSVEVAYPNDVGAHDSNMVIIDGVAYIVYCGSEVKGTVDNAGGEFAKVRLIQWDIERQSPISYEVVAENKTKIEDCFISIGAGQPNIIRVSADTLRIIFSTYIEQDGVELSCIAACDYSLINKTFSDYKLLKLQDREGGYILLNPALINQKYPKAIRKDCTLSDDQLRTVQPQMNATISYDGENYYACILAGSTMKGLVMTSKDLISWQYVCVPPSEICAAFECAVAYSNDNLYLAFRQQGSNSKYSQYGVDNLSLDGYANGMPVYKYNLTTEEFTDVAYLPDSSTRPEFFWKDDKLYLIHGGWAGRGSGYVTMINQENLRLSSIVRESRNAGNYQYCSVAEYNSKLYMCWSKGKIAFAQFDIDNYIDVDGTVRKLFGID